MSQTYDFTKMHGLGNDFVVFDGVNQVIELRPEQIRWIADRHFGIGCDQVLLVQPSPRADAAFSYRIFNADGGEVEQCGNGARCFARFVRDRGLIDAREFTVITRGGDLGLRIEDTGEVTVAMGIPRFEPADIPFDAPRRESCYDIDVQGERYTVGAVSMGNPHAVLQVTDLDSAPVLELGPLLGAHPRFPQQVNVGFMQLIDREHIRLRVFERGSGETLACGSGACAAVAVGVDQGRLASTVQVELPGGRLTITWEGARQPVYMTGPVAYVFEGRIRL